MIQLLLTTLLLAAPLLALESNATKFTTLSEDPLFHAKRESGLSLHDSLNRAIENSPKINAARELVIQDKMKVEEAFAGHLPVVNFSGDGGYEARDVKADPRNPVEPVKTIFFIY